jgi:hypothetical protein
VARTLSLDKLSHNIIAPNVSIVRYDPPLVCARAEEMGSSASEWRRKVYLVTRLRPRPSRRRPSASCSDGTNTDTQMIRSYDPWRLAPQGAREGEHP